MKTFKRNLTIIKATEKILFVLFLLTFFVTGCSKKKGCTNSIAINFDSGAEKDDGSCQLAGLGGNTTIVARPQHHGKTIYNQTNYPDSAFIKFNTKEFPGSHANDYDAIFTGNAGEDHVHVEGLKPGYYYIYMTGFDTSITQRVTGGIPIKLTQSTGEVEQIVPVTE